MNCLAANLRQLMSVNLLSENELSRNCGVPQPTIHRILAKRVKDPRDRTLRPLANYFGISVEQLRTTLPAEPQLGEPGADYNDEPARHPMIDEVELHATPGETATAPAFVATSQRQSFSPAWFLQANARPEQVRLMRVVGSSMERTLFHGDQVVVNLTETTPIIDGRVYVFTTAGNDPDVKIKRLFKTADGRLRVVSDNPDKMLHPDEMLRQDEAATNVFIVGRVISKSGNGGL